MISLIHIESGHTTLIKAKQINGKSCAFPAEEEIFFVKSLVEAEDWADTTATDVADLTSPIDLDVEWSGFNIKP